MKDTYIQLQQKIKEAHNIAIISHKFPDWDTISSMVAFFNVINDNFQNKKVDMINSDNLPEKLVFLGNMNVIKKELIKNYDLYIFVDVWDIKLAWFWETRDDYKDCFIINIDHHPFNIWYWDINIIEPEKASTTEILYNLFTDLNFKINNEASQALLTWIYTDTGAFSYSNTTSNSFEVSADLLEKSFWIKSIINNFFNNNTFNFIKLLGLVFERIKVNKDGAAFSYLKKEDIINMGCKYEELDGVSWRLNKLSNVKYICFLYEKWDNVKWSLRTVRDDINVAEIAKIHNWWWHRKASAFLYEWKLVILDNGDISIKTKDNIINLF